MHRPGSRAEWLKLLATSEMPALVDQVKIINRFIRTNQGDLYSLYEHLALIKQIGEFLYGDIFLRKYLETQGFHYEESTQNK